MRSAVSPWKNLGVLIKLIYFESFLIVFGDSVPELVLQRLMVGLHLGLFNET
jgi:hypothetical protein